MRRALTLVCFAALALPTAAVAGIRIGEANETAYPTVRVTVVTSTRTSRPPLLRENGKPIPADAQNLGRGGERRDRHRPLTVDGGAGARTRHGGRPELHRA